MRNFLTLTATPYAVLDCPVKERPFGEASFTESQARALALLCWQLTIADLRRLASSEEEAHDARRTCQDTKHAKRRCDTAPVAS
jgi:hypothetical protein